MPPCCSCGLIQVSVSRDIGCNAFFLWVFSILTSAQGWVDIEWIFISGWTIALSLIRSQIWTFIKPPECVQVFGKHWKMKVIIYLTQSRTLSDKLSHLVVHESQEKHWKLLENSVWPVWFESPSKTPQHIFPRTLPRLIISASPLLFLKADNFIFTRCLLSSAG